VNRTPPISDDGDDIANVLEGGAVFIDGRGPVAGHESLPGDHVGDLIKFSIDVTVTVPAPMDPAPGSPTTPSPPAKLPSPQVVSVPFWVVPRRGL
jgi:hypothetical protein